MRWRSARGGAGPERTVGVDVGPTRCTRGINALSLVIHAHAPPVAGCRAGYSCLRSHPRLEKGPRAVQMPSSALLARCTRHPVTALSERRAGARRLPAVLRARVGAYVALTKPRIIGCS